MTPERCKSIATGCNAQCGLPEGHCGRHQNGLHCRTWANDASHIPSPANPDEEEMLWGDKSKGETHG